MSKSGFTFEYSSYTKDLVIYQKKTIGLSDGYKQNFLSNRQPSSPPPQKKINHHLVMYWMGEKGQGTDLQKAKDSELQ